MPGLQTVTTPVTGTAISSTLFGDPVANNLTVLANPPAAKMRNSTTQSIANTTTTALTWDTEDFDTVGGHSTVTNTSRYTVQTGYAGKYRLNATVFYAGNATGDREMFFFKNGSAIAGSQGNNIPGAATAVSASSTCLVQLAVGDFVEAFTFQNSGGALSTATGSNGRESYFEVLWVSQ